MHYFNVSDNISYHILSYHTLFPLGMYLLHHIQCKSNRGNPLRTSSANSKSNLSECYQATSGLQGPKDALCPWHSWHTTTNLRCHPSVQPQVEAFQSSFTVYNTSIDVYINTSPIKDNIGTVWYSIYTFLKIKILLSQCLYNLSQNGLMPADGHRNQHAALAQHSVHLADGCLHFLWTNKWIVHIHIVKWTARLLEVWY